MHSRFLQQVLLALSSLILSKAQDVTGLGLSCLTSSSADEGQTRVAFLREDTAGARSLYLTLWSEDRRLLTCEVHRNAFTTEKYASVCDRSGNQGQEISQRFNISALSSLDAPCALASSVAPKFAGRRKRAWILPGTLWCGTGSGAVGYEQLGMFENADRCCREHDHCLDTIPAFTMNYGVFNSKFYTVSHCDCDQRFRHCLLDVNDTISSMVGYSFFNILRVPCFELKQKKQCTKMYWWGMCKEVKEAPYAIFKSPLPYNASDVTSKYGDNTHKNNLTSSEGERVTESPVISPRRKSQKSQQRCGFRSRDPPRGDNFYRRRTKGKGCKMHQNLSTVAPSQMPSLSSSHKTTPSLKTDLLNGSPSRKLTSNKKRDGKKKSPRKDLLAYPTQKSQVLPQVNMYPYPQTSSTTQRTLPLTKKQKLQPKAITPVTKTTKGCKNVPKQSRCCRSRTSVRGDNFWPHCKSCLAQETTSHRTAVTAAATTNGMPISLANLWTLQLKKKTNTPKQDTLKILRNTATFATPITTKLKTATSLYKDGKPQKQVDSNLMGNNSGQGPVGGTIAQGTHVGRGLKQNNGFLNVTDNQLLCGSLKNLDECKYQIPPLEKKYNLQNMESKTAYHCDCTSRLAVQIKTFKKPSILPMLLKDFMSQYCFKLSEEKKCHRRKSCSGGFIKDSDLLQALKKIEEKDTAGVQNSGNNRNRNRGILIRLYKRCLRLGRDADIMARLT